MNKKIIWYILNKIRFVLCIPFLMVLGLITCPFTLLLKWQGISILWIANAESCSLSEAKKILKENIKYPDIGKVYFTSCGSSISSLNISSGTSTNYENTLNSSSQDFYNQIVSSPAYSHLPCNTSYSPITEQK